MSGAKCEQLSHVQIDVDFWNKPKCKAFRQKHGPVCALFYLDILLALGDATNAEILREDVIAIGEGSGLDTKTVTDAVEYLVSRGMLTSVTRDSRECICNERIKRNQEALSITRQGFRDRQQRRRQGNKTKENQVDIREKEGEGVTRDTSVTLNTQHSTLNNVFKEGVQGEKPKPKRKKNKSPFDPQTSISRDEYIQIFQDPDYGNSDKDFCRKELKKFQDWLKKTGNEFIDYAAAYRNWLAKAREYQKSHAGVTQVSQLPSRPQPQKWVAPEDRPGFKPGNGVDPQTKAKLDELLRTAALKVVV